MKGLIAYWKLTFAFGLIAIRVLAVSDPLRGWAQTATLRRRLLGSAASSLALHAALLVPPGVTILLYPEYIRHFDILWVCIIASVVVPVVVPLMWQVTVRAAEQALMASLQLTDVATALELLKQARRDGRYVPQEDLDMLGHPTVQAYLSHHLESGE